MRRERTVKVDTLSGDGRKRSTNKESTIISFHVPIRMLRIIDELVAQGFASNRSELIRTAIALYLRDLANTVGVLEKEQVPVRLRMAVGYR